MTARRRGARLVLAPLCLATACAPSPTAPRGAAPTPTPAAVVTCAGTGRVEHTTAPFGAPGEDRVAVYLPPCYATDPQRRFPVLVLLHGANADETQWLDVGVAADADALLAAGEIQPFIIVLPDGGPRVPDDLALPVTQHLLPWIDARYRTAGGPRRRAIGGISRGGRLALLTAALEPETFAAVGGHSPAVEAANATGAVTEAMSSHRDAFRLDIGSDDRLRAGVEQFVAQLREGGARIELHVAGGSHDRAYWRAHTAEYLTFYSARLG